jgi:hypothetical protein
LRSGVYTNRIRWFKPFEEGAGLLFEIYTSIGNLSSETFRKEFSVSQENFPLRPNLTLSLEDSLVLEIYDGPHYYPEKKPY